MRMDRPNGGGDDGAALVAQTLSESLNAAAMLAAPKAWAVMERLGRPDPKGDLVTVFVALEEVAARTASGRLTISTADPMGAILVAGLAGGAVSEAVAKLRGALDPWEGRGTPPPEVRSAAGALLALLGVPEPPSGWEAFDPDDDEDDDDEDDEDEG